MGSWVGPLHGKASPSVALSKLDRFPSLHRGLLSEYVRVLQEASTPQASRWRRRWLGDPAARTPYASRKLAEAHISRRLLTLAAIYGQLSVIYDEPLGPELEQARRDCETFAGTLPAWRLPTVLAIVPLVIGVLGQIRGTLAHADLGSIIAATWSYVLYWAVLAFVVVRKAFRRKREMFFPNAIAAERHGAADDNDKDRNVYRSERELFDALDWAKPIEAPLDHIAVVLTTSTLALAIFAFDIYVVPVDHALWYGLWVAGGVVGYVPVIQARRRLARRKWR